MLPNKLKKDMSKTADRLMRLDELSQIIIISKIDALYERQKIDEEKVAGLLNVTESPFTMS